MTVSARPPRWGRFFGASLLIVRMMQRSALPRTSAIGRGALSLPPSDVLNYDGLSSPPALGPFLWCLTSHRPDDATIGPSPLFCDRTRCIVLATVGCSKL